MNPVEFFRRAFPVGSLVFDVGANRGELSTVFLEAGAGKVVAVEPLFHCGEMLDLIADKSEGRLVVEHCAVGAKREAGNIYYPLWDKRSGVASMSLDYIDTSEKHQIYGPHTKWNGSQFTEIVTLYNLFQKHGVPDFIKIDVEGYEKQVIRGMLHPSRVLSFEFHPLMLIETFFVLGYLDSLGYTHFNFCMKASYEFWFHTPVDLAQLGNALNSLDKNDLTLYGDVYAWSQE